MARMVPNPDGVWRADPTIVLKLLLYQILRKVEKNELVALLIPRTSLGQCAVAFRNRWLCDFAGVSLRQILPPADDPRGLLILEWIIEVGRTDLDAESGVARQHGLDLNCDSQRLSWSYFVDCREGDLAARVDPAVGRSVIPDPRPDLQTGLVGWEKEVGHEIRPGTRKPG